MSDPENGPPTFSETELAQRDQELGQLLAHALDLPPAEQEAFLASSSADPDLIREVSALLRREQDFATLLDQPAAYVLGLDSPAEPALTDAVSPKRLGPYTIVRCLGQGGMGEVYLAEQSEPVERQVALKLALRFETNPEAQHRFLLERKALGRLAHPNIARLYEAGTTSEGRPFVAMELVHGPRITDYADQHNLSIEDRLRLFLQVCRGALHAHQKQLLHRDLKPSNILVEEVDGQPVVKLIDFGIAKALDQNIEHTFATGDRLLGTPQYMSPEALEPSNHDDLDTRTDVYSLGVVLYELVTGARPFTKQGDLAHLLREILEEDAPRPSARLTALDGATRYRVAAARSLDAEGHYAALAGDLDWIVAKAMAKNRDERYGSVAELAAELERVLDHLPILARPPSRLYQFRKLVRRHRLAVTLTTLTALGLLTAILLTSTALLHARRSGEQSRRDAEVSHRTLGFVVDLFEAANPGEAPGREATARDLLAEGVRRLRERDLPPLARAQILHTLGEVHVRMGLYSPARELLTESLEIREQTLPPDAAEVLASAQVLGNLERRAGRLDAAEVLLQKVLAVAEASADPPLLAAALNSLGNLRWSQQRFAEAEILHRQALDLRVAHLEPTAVEVAASHNNLGALLLSMDQYGAAEPHLRRAADLLEMRHGPKHPRVADALGNLALVLRRLGKNAESELLQRRSLGIRRGALGDDHPSTATAFHNLSGILSVLGRDVEAEDAGRRALELRRRALGDEHPETVKALAHLGFILWRMKRYEDAEPLLTQAVDLRRRRLTPGDSALARSRRNLALVWRDRGQLERAALELRDVLELQRTQLGASHRDVASTLHHLGVLVALGTPASDLGVGDAEALFLESIAIRREQVHPTADLLADSLFAIAELYRRGGRVEEAASHHREAFELRRQVLPEGHPDLARSAAAVAP